MEESVLETGSLKSMIVCGGHHDGVFLKAGIDTGKRFRTLQITIAMRQKRMLLLRL
jgi:hypothetical protein